MAFLWLAKLRAAVVLDSSTLFSDAQCSLGCIQLSVILFVGSLLFMLYDRLWWVDSATTLIIATLIFREGVKTVRASFRADFDGCACCAESTGPVVNYVRRVVERKYFNASVWRSAKESC
eukprot:330519_1